MKAIYSLPVEKRFAVVSGWTGLRVEVGFSYLRSGGAEETVVGKALGVARPLTGGSGADSLVLELGSELVTISLATIRRIKVATR